MSGPAVLDRRGSGRRGRRAAQPRSAADRRRDVDEPGRARDEPELRDALAGEHERRPGLHEAERAVLAEMAALVLPVVRGGVQDAEVGRGGGGRRAGRSGRRRAGRRCRHGAGCGWARSSARGVNRSVDWSASGSRPSSLDPLVAAASDVRGSDPAVVGERLVGAVARRCTPCRRSDRGRFRAAPRVRLPPRPGARREFRAPGSSTFGFIDTRLGAAHGVSGKRVRTAVLLGPFHTPLSIHCLTPRVRLRLPLVASASPSAVPTVFASEKVVPTMPFVTSHMSISIDGFVAGPDQSADNPLGIDGRKLHDWHLDDPKDPVDEAFTQRLLGPRGDVHHGAQHVRSRTRRVGRLRLARLVGP